MKKVFNIIITICVIATVGAVAYNFFRSLDFGSKIYNQVYSYTQNLNSKSLVKELEECSALSKDVLTTTTITETQLSFIDEFAKTVSKLDEFEYSVSLNIITENKKSAKTSKIIKSLQDLEISRNKLLFELDIYCEKMSGNTIGDPISTYSNIVGKILAFINEYNTSFTTLKNYIVEEKYTYNLTKFNVFELYSYSLINLYNSYDEENLYFKNESFNTLKQFNTWFNIENNNLKTVVVGGVYSTTASNFNKNYEKTNKLEFVQNYHLKSYDSINILTEKQFDNLTFYYLHTLMEVK